MRSGQVAANRYLQIWRSKAFVFLLIVILLFMTISVVRELLRRWEIQYEIQQLETEVSRLEQRNMELRDVIALLNTSSMHDKEARVKLGVQEPGETVVMFPQNTQEPITLPDSDRIRYIPIRDFTSNPEKWFSFFWDKFKTTY